jgi:hypothetical protein
VRPLVRCDRSDGVTRIALQNAASIASLMLTTEAMVAEIDEKNWPAPRWLWAGRNELLISPDFQ